MDELSAVVFIFTIMIPLVFCYLYILALKGGFLGILLGWCAGVLAVIPIYFAIRCIYVRTRRCRWRPLWGGLALLVMAPLVLLVLSDGIHTWLNNPVFDLGSPQAGCSRTRIEFRGDGKTTVVHDPFNRMRFCFGGKPDEVRVMDGERVVIFTKGVIIKSWTDDVEVSPNCIGIGGWMGASLPSGTDVWIGSDGRYQSPPSCP